MSKPHAEPTDSLHNSVTPATVHDVWLSQRAELERELFDGDSSEPQVLPIRMTPPQPVVVIQSAPPTSPAVVAQAQKPSSSIVKQTTQPFERLEDDSAQIAVSLPFSERRAAVEALEDASLKGRVIQQQQVEQELSRQREAFQRDLSQHRLAFEAELAGREAAWSEQRDKEWSSLRQAKEVQDVSLRQVQQELAEQRVREREELLAWRRQAEVELAEARRMFEQERLQQQQEFARQRETEIGRLRCEREELENRLRQAHTEIAATRQTQEMEVRNLREAQAKQLQAERAELDQLRETWMDKLRREQVVLESGMKFFEHHLSRVSEELRMAQNGLQAITASAAEASLPLPFQRTEWPNLLNAQYPAAPTAAPVDAAPAPTTLLSLNEIRDRLRQLKQPEKVAA